MPRYGSVQHLYAEGGKWFFTLSDGKKFRTGVNGVGLEIYSPSAKKYKQATPEEVGGLRFVSVIRQAAIKQIRDHIGDLQIVHDLGDKTLTIASVTPGAKGRKPLSFYGVDPVLGTNPKKSAKAKKASVKELIAAGVVENNKVNKFRLFSFGHKK